MSDIAFLNRGSVSGPSAPKVAAYSRHALLAAALLTMAAHEASRPAGDLLLDAADPVVAVTIEGIPFRLRVDLDQQDTVELNPAAAARLALPWEDGMRIEVGRVQLTSRVAPATLRIAGRDVPIAVSEHRRECCAAVDGAIGPHLLPYATVSWRRAGAAAANGSVTLLVKVSAMTGLSAPAGAPGVRLRFAFDQPQAVATAAAGATLARLWHGSWAAPPERVTVAFGISRPARLLRFSAPGVLAGFRFDRMIVRYSDFPGADHLPADPIPAGDVVVSRRLTPGHDWSAVTIGREQLDRCASIIYALLSRSLTLRCAFDRP